MKTLIILLLLVSNVWAQNGTASVSSQLKGIQPEIEIKDPASESFKKQAALEALNPSYPLTLEKVKDLKEKMGLDFNEPLDAHKNPFLNILVKNHSNNPNIKNIIIYVVDHGANPTIANDAGLNAYDIAPGIETFIKTPKNSKSTN